MGQIHYEVFRQQGVGGGWSLVEAHQERKPALEQAKTMFAEGKAAAVKVVKETLLPDGNDYMSLIIFEEAHKKSKKKKPAPGDPDKPLPCFKPDDLYSYHARMTIARLLDEWLARQRLTVTEFLHSAQALEVFEATGTLFQHAVQKIAVAEAAEIDTSVTKIIKQLNELCTKAIVRVTKSERSGAFPIVEAGKIPRLAEQLSGRSDGAFILNGVLAKYLAPAKGWDEKLQLLLVLMPALPAEGPARTLLLGAIDNLVAELLNSGAALADLLGPSPDLGHALFNLAQLFLGEKLDSAEGAKDGIVHLARYFAKDDLPNGRSAIAVRILTELRGMKRLCSSQIDEELKMLRKLANYLVRGQGKYLSNEDLIGAFTERSKRVVTHEPLANYLLDAKSDDEKVERLLVVEENIIGAENKRNLFTFIMPFINSNAFEKDLCKDAALSVRMRRVAELQTRILRSGFQEVQKNHMAAALDAAALGIETRANLLKSIEQNLPNPAERAQALLKLYASNIFTQGELDKKAKKCLLAALGKPGFFTGHVKRLETESNGAVDPGQAMSELVAQLEQIGIPPDQGKRAVAA